MRTTIFILCCLMQVSCFDFNKPYVDSDRKVLGYVPVYSTDSSVLRIYTDHPEPVRAAGKIYVKGNLIFQNDLGRGIHVVDNSIPDQAKKIGFIHLPGNLEISIKGNYLYANSYSDLVVVDLSNWQQAKEIKRVKHAFLAGGYSGVYIPLPEKDVYYECPNPSKGIQTGWKKDSVSSYVCHN